MHRLLPQLPPRRRFCLQPRARLHLSLLPATSTTAPITGTPASTRAPTTTAASSTVDVAPASLSGVAPASGSDTTTNSISTTAAIADMPANSAMSSTGPPSSMSPPTIGPVSAVQANIAAPSTIAGSSSTGGAAAAAAPPFLAALSATSKPLPPPVAAKGNAPTATVIVTPDDVQYPDLTCAINLPEDEIHTASNEKAIDGLGAPARFVPRSLGKKLHQFWENGSTITYSFIGGTSNQQAKVGQVAGYSFGFVNITFQLVDQDGMIRISFDPNLGSWSYVGKANLKVRAPKATMNLASVPDTTNPGLPETLLILHEFGHVLGMMHEYLGPTNGGTVTLDDEAVYSFYSHTLGWDRKIVKAQILDVYSTASVSNFAAADTASMMRSVILHRYFMPSALNSEHLSIPPPMSQGDVASINDEYYLFINYPPTAPTQTTIPEALQTFGVDDATALNISNAYAAGNITRGRAIFNAWLLSARAAPPGPTESNPQSLR
ncbi:hypothetical protein FB451DRAFT_1568025 [Mycena latifolia]|nr:hypothetical protein FB451DRAFT_1568025 [Mycena latifolia]